MENRRIRSVGSIDTCAFLIYKREDRQGERERGEIGREGKMENFARRSQEGDKGSPGEAYSPVHPS